VVFGACGGQRTNLNLFTHQCAGFLTGSAAGTHGWLGFSLVKTKRRASGDRRNSAMTYNNALCSRRSLYMFHTSIPWASSSINFGNATTKPPVLQLGGSAFTLKL
jgi:hypothetical protein